MVPLDIIRVRLMIVGIMKVFACYQTDSMRLFAGVAILSEVFSGTSLSLGTQQLAEIHRDIGQCECPSFGQSFPAAAIYPLHHP